jgi:hypothetical protein
METASQKPRQYGLHIMTPKEGTHAGTFNVSNVKISHLEYIRTERAMMGVGTCFVTESLIRPLS